MGELIRQQIQLVAEMAACEPTIEVFTDVLLAQNLFPLFERRQNGDQPDLREPVPHLFRPRGLNTTGTDQECIPRPRDDICVLGDRPNQQDLGTSSQFQLNSTLDCTEFMTDVLGYKRNPV